MKLTISQFIALSDEEFQGLTELMLTFDYVDEVTFNDFLSRLHSHTNPLRVNLQNFLVDELEPWMKDALLISLGRNDTITIELPISQFLVLSEEQRDRVGKLVFASSSLEDLTDENFLTTLTSRSSPLRVNIGNFPLAQLSRAARKELILSFLKNDKITIELTSQLTVSEFLALSDEETNGLNELILTCKNENTDSITDAFIKKLQSCPHILRVGFSHFPVDQLLSEERAALIKSLMENKNIVIIDNVALSAEDKATLQLRKFNFIQRCAYIDAQAQHLFPGIAELIGEFEHVSYDCLLASRHLTLQDIKDVGVLDSEGPFPVVEASAPPVNYLRDYYKRTAQMDRKRVAACLSPFAAFPVALVLIPLMEKMLLGTNRL